MSKRVNGDPFTHKWTGTGDNPILIIFKLNCNYPICKIFFAFLTKYLLLNLCLSNIN